MNTQLLNSLPPPGGLVTVACTEDVLRIELKPVFAPWTKSLYASLFPLAIAALGLIGFSISKWGNARGAAAGLIVVGVIAGFAVFLATLIGLGIPPALSVLYGLIICDGRSVLITDTRKQLNFPVDQIRGVRVTIRRQRTMRIAPEKPPCGFFSIGPSAGLDIETTDGCIRLFREWDVEDLQWISGALNLYLGLETPVTTSPTDSPIVDPRGYLGTLWKPLFAICLLAALMCFAWAGYHLYYGLSSRSWPSTAGRVTNSFVAQQRGSFTAEISYTYRVAAQVFNSTRIDYFCGTPRGAGIRNLVKTHATGSRVTVFYDPGDPARAVLLRGNNWLDWLILSYGLPLSGVCILIFRKRSSPQQQALAQRYDIRGGIGKHKIQAGDDDPINLIFR